MKKYRINWERVYTLALTIGFIVLAIVFIESSSNINMRLEQLEDQKNESCTDHYSIQLLKK